MLDSLRELLLYPWREWAKFCESNLLYEIQIHNPVACHWRVGHFVLQTSTGPGEMRAGRLCPVLGRIPVRRGADSTLDDRHPMRHVGH